MDTVIKISTKTAHENLTQYKVFMNLNRITKKSFDVQKYNCVYDGVIEQGVIITFFETLGMEALFGIHRYFRHNFKDYNCYYLDNEFFSGCIKKYLYNRGCSVEFTYK